MSLSTGKAKLLKIYLGESDHYQGKPLYEILVLEARSAGMAGATVTKGIMSFGASHSIHTMKIFALSSDMPVVLEIVDDPKKIEIFSFRVNELLEKAGKGALVTVQDLEVISYREGKKYCQVK